MEKEDQKRRRVEEVREGKSGAQLMEEYYEERKRSEEAYERHKKEGIPCYNFMHVGLYSGRSKIRRLLFAADLVGPLKNHFLEMAYLNAKTGNDTTLFKRVVSSIKESSLGPDYNMDNAWCDAVDAQARDLKDTLLARFNQDNFVKEDLMTAYNDLRDFYFTFGHLPDALHSYARARARDFCVSPQHLLYSYMKSIPVAIELEQYALLATFVSKAQLLPRHRPVLTLSKLQCASGLAHLAAKDFKLAADMLAHSLERGRCPPSRRVALYAVLCSLATYSWTELQLSLVTPCDQCVCLKYDDLHCYRLLYLAGQSFYDTCFREFCKLLPVLNALIEGFRKLDAGVCWSRLRKMKSSLMQDIYLHDHVETLCSQIRGEVLFNFLTRGPACRLRRVDLNRLADHLDATVLFGDNLDAAVDEVETQLGCLIERNRIQAWIDADQNVMHMNGGNS